MPRHGQLQHDARAVQRKALKDLGASCSDKEAEQKYLNSTCYYIGPILKPALKDSPALAQQLNATAAVTQVQDSWVSGAIFTAAEVSLLCLQLAQAVIWHFLGIMTHA